MPKRCRLVVDTACGLRECELVLPPDATLQAALEAARAQLPDVTIDWDSAPVGVFGQVRSRAYVPIDGDRIEVYRNLLKDPRQSRRQRAGRTGQR